jgi:MADS-box transcription factor
MGRRRIEIKKILNETARKTTFKKRKQGFFKKATELCILTGCKISLSIITEQGVEHVFDPSVLQPSKDTTRSLESDEESGGVVATVEEALQTPLVLPEPSSSSLAGLEASKDTMVSSYDMQSFDALSLNFNDCTDMMPIAGPTGMPTWDESLLTGCIDSTTSLQNIFVPPAAFEPSFTDPYGLSFYSPFPYLLNNSGWGTESSMQMPALLGYEMGQISQ